MTEASAQETNQMAGTRADLARRMNEERDKRLLDAALTLAERNGFQTLNRREIAQAAGMAVGTVSFAFGGMAGFYDAVMREAIERGCLAVLAQGIALDNRIARDAPDELKRQALNSFTP